MNSHIAVVVPIYKCADCLSTLSFELIAKLSTITENFELILINDSSPDESWDIIKTLAMTDQRIKGINLSRNFGQHSAITAGLDFSNADWTVIMDCDLQDKPEEVLKLYAKAQEGYDIVFGNRLVRKDNFFKKAGSKIFYKVLSYFINEKKDSRTANFSIISKNVLNHIKTLREHNRFYPFFVNWVGFKSTKIDIEHSKRHTGKSSYTFSALLELGVNTIISQSNVPLKLSIKFGFTLALFSFIYSIFLIARYLISDIAVEGWTSVMVSIYFVAGLLFINLGVLGLYIGKIFDETKNRPLYIIQDTTFTV